MSTERGNASRTRTQKYKNRTVFKNDLHDKTVQQKRINALHISEVCQHCKSVIEWKIKYKKYKPLTQKKTCTRCQQRNITKAYHVLCRSCALEAHVCAKCLKSAAEVEIEPPQPAPQEEQRLQVEMNRLVKSLSERKRRTFLRYMEKGKKQASETMTEEYEHELEPDSKPKQHQPRVPYSRDELLQKFEELKLVDDDDDDEDGDFDTDDDDEDEGEYADSESNDTCS